MHGTVHRDSKGNSVRILDIVPGPTLYGHIDSLKMDYETYFRTVLPLILKNIIRAFEAIRFLHINGLKHGDIRNDHIIVEEGTGNYVWIDFDYDYEASENPYGIDLFGLGNILTYAIGKGFHTLHELKDRSVYGDLIDRVDKEDFSLLDWGRLLNLKKLYPDVPSTLNDVVMHFSKGTEIYYEFAEEIIEDLNRCLYAIY